MHTGMKHGGTDMFCIKCGKELPYGITICEDCASNQIPTVPPQQSPASAQPNPKVETRPAYSDSDSIPMTNGMAIASLVTSLLGIGILGLILGIIANNQIKSSMGRQKGSGLAIAGIIISSFGIVFAVMWGVSALALFPVFNRARGQAQNSACLLNLKQLSLGIMMYVQDYNENMPPAARWSDVISPYVRNNGIYVCPSASTLTCGYSFYDKLNMASMKMIASPFDTPMLFDSVGGWNSVSPIEQVVARHNGGYNCSFADGHAKRIGDGGGIR